MKQKKTDPQTPYYLIDERALLGNLKKIRHVREVSGAKSLLALKCFAVPAVFGLMRKYMDGTTSSSLYEARLGYEEFGKETHAYCAAYSDRDIAAVKKYADKIIFNSLSQLERYHEKVRGIKTGVRVNPQFSYSHYDLANPARRYSRLGVVDTRALLKAANLISGAMFHINCENDDFGAFSRQLDSIAATYGELLSQLEWVSLGGGIYFTKKGYSLEKFCTKLKKFSKKFDIQIYLEPGESAITRSAELIATVVDIVHNEVDIAIVDTSTEAHMLDLLIYRTSAKMDSAGTGKHRYMIAGRSCLAGDVFGTFRFRSPLKIGSTVRIADAAGYSMVKKNWFNGLQMPSIAVKRLNGKTEILRQFGYKDFLNNLS